MVAVSRTVITTDPLAARSASRFDASPTPAASFPRFRTDPSTCCPASYPGVKFFTRSLINLPISAVRICQQQLLARALFVDEALMAMSRHRHDPKASGLLFMTQLAIGSLSCQVESEVRNR